MTLELTDRERELLLWALGGSVMLETDAGAEVLHLLEKIAPGELVRIPSLSELGLV